VTPNFIGACDGNTTVTLTWTTSNADEVRISLDPGPQKPIDAVYESGLLPDSSLSGLSYGCNPTYSDANGGYHEYVVIAVRGKSYSWRSIKVYVHPPT